MCVCVCVGGLWCVHVGVWGVVCVRVCTCVGGVWCVYVCVDVYGCGVYVYVCGGCGVCACGWVWCVYMCIACGCEWMCGGVVCMSVCVCGWECGCVCGLWCVCMSVYVCV